MMVTQLCYGYLTHIRRLTLGRSDCHMHTQTVERNDWEQTQSRGTSGQLLLSPGGNFAGNSSTTSPSPLIRSLAHLHGKRERIVGVCVCAERDVSVSLFFPFCQPAIKGCGYEPDSRFYAFFASDSRITSRQKEDAVGKDVRNQ